MSYSVNMIKKSMTQRVKFMNAEGTKYSISMKKILEGCSERYGNKIRLRQEFGEEMEDEVTVGNPIREPLNQ